MCLTVNSVLVDGDGEAQTNKAPNVYMKQVENVEDREVSRE